MQWNTSNLCIGDNIIEQSVSVRAVPKLIVGEAGRQSNFSAKPRPRTSGQTMLKCISKQKLIKIYHVVLEL